MSPKTFIITGASKGIGAAVTQRLLSQSHNVVLTARSGDLLEKVKSAHRGRVEYIAGEITEDGISNKLVDLAVKAFGQVDGLIINHGILLPKKFADTSLDEMRKVYDINVLSCIAVAQASIAELRKSKGSMVWISTGAAIKAYAGWSSYGSTKAAINSISAHIAVEEADITSIAIAPGRVDTDMQATLRAEGKDSMDKAVYETFVEAFGQGTLLKPEQPGNVVAGVAAEPPKALSGKFLSWNSPELAAYQS